jgi:hypothetical protein
MVAAAVDFWKEVSKGMPAWGKVKMDDRKEMELLLRKPVQPLEHSAGDRLHWRWAEHGKRSGDLSNADRSQMCRGTAAPCRLRP